MGKFTETIDNSRGIPRIIKSKENTFTRVLTLLSKYVTAEKGIDHELVHQIYSELMRVHQSVKDLFESKTYGEFLINSVKVKKLIE